MPKVPDSQPTSLSQRTTTAPSNDLNVDIIRDSNNGQISPHDDGNISVGRPSEDH